MATSSAAAEPRRPAAAPVVAGVSHRSADVSVQERLAAHPAGRVLDRLRDAGWAEAVVLSTCNRFEVYAPADEGRDAEALQALLSELAGASLDGAAYRKSGASAVEHLFGVAAGLESMVLGEGEILGQVKGAYEAARTSGMTGTLTNVLFQRAVYVGKQVRTATGIGQGRTSVASAAVELAQRIFGELSESRVLVLGAGQTAELAAKHLKAAEVPALHVCNRTWERAEALASRMGGRPWAWEERERALAEADIVVASTGSDKPILDKACVERAMKARRGKALFLIDIAMPRDVDEAVNELDQVYLYSLRDLEAIVAESMSGREGELERAQALVRELSGEFCAWLEARALGERAALKHSEAAA